MSFRKIHIAVLDTDIPEYNVFAKRGLYSSQFNYLLTAAADRINADSRRSSKKPLSVHISAFDIVGGSYPHPTTLRDSPRSSMEQSSPGAPGPIDAILVTGAAAAVYDDFHWIKGLQSFIERVYANYPLVKIFGSCFGHQIIGEALLASEEKYILNEESFKVSVEATSQGHEIGIFPITLNPSLVSRFPPLDRFSKENFYVQLIHGDAVISTPDTAAPAGTSGELLPEPWHNLGSSEKCPIQGLYKPGHVLTLQGHFEFDAFATTELCKKFARQFGWSQEVLDTHLKNIWRSAGPGRHEFAEALVLFFAGEDHIDEQ